MQRLTFVVDYPGEISAGLRPFTDVITVDIESGDPGGDAGEFEGAMRLALVEWFDGAGVTLASSVAVLPDKTRLDFFENHSHDFHYVRVGSLSGWKWTYKRYPVYFDSIREAIDAGIAKE